MSDILYSSYDAWKRWKDFFTYSRDDAGYLAGELAKVKVDAAHILEIGFGSGSCLAWLKAQGAVVHGTEISESSIKAAKKIGVPLLPTDLADATSEWQDYFDTVIAFDVFEHLSFDEISSNLTALGILLREGGRLILRFPNGQSPFGLQPQMGDPTHKVALSLSVFELLIERRPYRVVHYGPSYTYLGGDVATRVVRGIRFLVRGLITLVLNFIYATKIPYDPVTVLVLERTSNAQLNEHR